MRLRLLLLPFFLLTGSCQKSTPEPTLTDVINRLETINRKIKMGDTGHLQLAPFQESTWFLIVPPMADAVSFETAAPAFAKAQPEAVTDLSGKNVYALALVSDGKVEYRAVLDRPFFVEKVLAKPGKVTNGLRIQSIVRPDRTYRIFNID